MFTAIDCVTRRFSDGLSLLVMDANGKSTNEELHCGKPVCV